MDKTDWVIVSINVLIGSVLLYIFWDIIHLYASSYISSYLKGK